jgi:hypothetical protein
MNYKFSQLSNLYNISKVTETRLKKNGKQYNTRRLYTYKPTRKKLIGRQLKRWHKTMTGHTGPVTDKMNSSRKYRKMMTDTGDKEVIL